MSAVSWLITFLLLLTLYLVSSSAAHIMCSISPFPSPAFQLRAWTQLNANCCRSNKCTFRYRKFISLRIITHSSSIFSCTKLPSVNHQAHNFSSSQWVTVLRYKGGKFLLQFRDSSSIIRLTWGNRPDTEMQITYTSFTAEGLRQKLAVPTAGSAECCEFTVQSHHHCAALCAGQPVTPCCHTSWLLFPASFNSCQPWEEF